MTAWGQATAEVYTGLPLHAHEFLAEVPLHDVWTLDLQGADDALTIDDLRRLMNEVLDGQASAPVRFLFALRAALGRVFGWDAGSESAREPELVARVPEAILSRSTTPPGTRDGPFRIVYALPGEAVSEVRNATVLAYSVLALAPMAGGRRVVWAIHVAPVGRITRFYMALIDPFRHYIVYPSILKRAHAAWQRRNAG